LRVALDPFFGEATVARALAGPFRLVQRTPNRIVVAKPGLRIVFVRMGPFAAARAFRQGRLDEAPVRQGEIRAIEADPTLGPALRARALSAVDAIRFEPSVPQAVRRAYWLSVPRAEYQGLISERVAPPAYSLVPGAEAIGPAEAREARRSIRSLPRVPVRLAVPNRPELVEAAEIAWAEWRQLGLPVTLAPGAREAEARFVRLVGPRPEGRADRPEVALVVPLGHVAEARLVSPRVRGWQMDAHGVVDYSRVTVRP
jgi:hypothetical protein